MIMKLNTFFQAQTKKVTEEYTLRYQDDYKEILEEVFRLL